MDLCVVLRLVWVDSQLAMGLGEGRVRKKVRQGSRRDKEENARTKKE